MVLTEADGVEQRATETARPARRLGGDRQLQGARSAARLPALAGARSRSPGCSGRGLGGRQRLGRRLGRDDRGRVPVGPGDRERAESLATARRTTRRSGRPRAATCWSSTPTPSCRPAPSSTPSRRWSAHPDIGALGPKLILADGTLDRACRRSFPSPEVAFYRLFGLAQPLPEPSALRPLQPAERGRGHGDRRGLGGRRVHAGAPRGRRARRHVRRGVQDVRRGSGLGVPDQGRPAGGCATTRPWWCCT